MYTGETLSARLMEFPGRPLAGWSSGILAITVCER